MQKLPLGLPADDFSVINPQTISRRVGRSLLALLVC
jgi:hypothetical protein